MGISWLGVCGLGDFVCEPSPRQWYHATNQCWRLLIQPPIQDCTRQLSRTANARPTLPQHIVKSWAFFINIDKDTRLCFMSSLVLPSLFSLHDDDDETRLKLSYILLISHLRSGGLMMKRSLSAGMSYSALTLLWLKLWRPQLLRTVDTSFPCG